MAVIVVFLKFFKPHLLPKRKSVWAETWWQSSDQHEDSEQLKSFCSDNQDLVGGNWATRRFRIAKIILLLSADAWLHPLIWGPCLLVWTFWFVIPLWIYEFGLRLRYHDRNYLLRYPKWPPMQPFWKSSIVSCSRAVSRIEPKLGGRQWAAWSFSITKMVLSW